MPKSNMVMDMKLFQIIRSFGLFQLRVLDYERIVQIKLQVNMIFLI